MFLLASRACDETVAELVATHADCLNEGSEPIVDLLAHRGTAALTAIIDVLVKAGPGLLSHIGGSNPDGLVEDTIVELRDIIFEPIASPERLIEIEAMLRVFAADGHPAAGTAPILGLRDSKRVLVIATETVFSLSWLFATALDVDFGEPIRWATGLRPWPADADVSLSL